MFGRRFTDMTMFQLMVPLQANDVQTNLADNWMQLEGLKISQVNPTSKHICVLGRVKSLDLRLETLESLDSRSLCVITMNNETG